MQIRKLFLNITRAFCLISVYNTLSLHAQSEILSPGAVKQVKESAQKIDIITENCFVSVTIYSPEVIRLRLNTKAFEEDFSYAVIAEPQKTNYQLSENDTTIELSTDSLIVSINKHPLLFTFKTKDGSIIQTDDEKLGTSIIGNEITTYKKLFDTERFLGLGEKTGPLDRRGNGYVNWNTDCYGYTPDTDPMYVSIPFYLGVHDHLCYGIFLDNSAKSNMNFGASNNRFSSFSVEAGDLNYYFIYSANIAGVINSYTALTGRTQMPAQWSLGFQQCRWSYYPDKEVLTIAKTFQEKQIPLDVIYLDIDYMDAYKIFTWNPVTFPQPKTMLNALKEMGLRTTIIVDPGIKIETHYPAYEDGLKKNIFLKYPDGSNYAGSVWPGLCHFPDFTKPDARLWWGNNFSGYVQDGVEGFWNDMNEPATWGQKFPMNVQFNFDGNSATTIQGRNVYGMQMARATFEGTKKLMNGKRPFVLTRAGYAGLQRYTTLWTGDNTPSDDHLLLGVRLVNSLGLSGVANCGVDVGGFNDDAPKELFARWISVGAFTPFFRSHKEINNRESEPWSYGEETEEIAKAYIKLRYKLMPYLYSTFYESTQTGMPVNRTLAIDYTSDNKIYESTYQNQYFFGEALLIAPVVSTAQFAKIYFPEGAYYDFYSDKKYEGNTEQIVEAPLYKLPVFVKAGSIIPQQTVVQNFEEKPSDTLFIHLYYGDKNNSFMYYEDDGETYEYESGKFYKREIDYHADSRTCIFRKPEGTYSSQFKTIKLLFHGFAEQTVFKINNQFAKSYKENISMLYDESAYRMLYFAERNKAAVSSLVLPNSQAEITISW